MRAAVLSVRLFPIPNMKSAWLTKASRMTWGSVGHGRYRGYEPMGTGAPD